MLNPSTAGICAFVSSCKTLLAVVPTSTFIVPTFVIVPATKPVPAITWVTLPPLEVCHSHCEPDVFQVNTWPLPGVPDFSVLPCRVVALLFAAWYSHCEPEAFHV